MKQEFLAGLAVLGSAAILVAFATGGSPQTQEITQEERPSGSQSPRVANASSGLDATSADEPALELVERSAELLRNSRPLQARLRFRTSMFGETVSGPGMYCQAGEGTRKSRIEFEFGFDEMAVSLRQFCDGNTLYTITGSGDEMNLEFVDLRQLDAVYGSDPDHPGYRTWLQAGSLSALMTQLSKHFDFAPAVESTLDGIPVVQCNGTWRGSALRQLLDGQPGMNAIEGDTIRWQDLPAHLPHQVRLTLGNDDRFPLFPYRIEFVQFAGDSAPGPARQIALLELYEVRHVAHMPDDLFRLPSMDCIPVDATDFYAERVQQFGR